MKFLLSYTWKSFTSNADGAHDTQAARVMIPVEEAATKVVKM